jgi:hypothetical protein
VSIGIGCRSQLFHLFVGQAMASTEEMDVESDMCEMLDAFHAMKRLPAISSHGEYTMIGQQKTVSLCQHRNECLADGITAGTTIRNQWDCADRRHHFRQQGLVQGASRSCERGGRGTMGVTDGSNIRTVSITGHVQAHLRRWLTLSFTQVELQVDQTQILGLHEALADSGWSTENLIFRNTDGHVPVIGSNPAQGVHPPADLTQIQASLHLFHCVPTDSTIEGSQLKSNRLWKISQSVQQ